MLRMEQATIEAYKRVYAGYVSAMRAVQETYLECWYRQLDTDQKKEDSKDD